MKFIILSLALLAGVVTAGPSSDKNIKVEGTLHDIRECGEDTLILECNWESKTRRIRRNLRPSLYSDNDISSSFDHCEIKGYQGGNDSSETIDIEAIEIEDYTMEYEDDTHGDDAKKNIYVVKIPLTAEIRAIAKLEISSEKDVNDVDVYTFEEVSVQWHGCD